MGKYRGSSDPYSSEMAPCFICIFMKPVMYPTQHLPKYDAG